MEPSTLKRLEQVRELSRQRLDVAPEFVLFQSIYAQLDFMCRLATGQESDRSRLQRVNIGRYAVREFEESDPEFARALKDAQYIAKGLKV